MDQARDPVATLAARMCLRAVRAVAIAAGNPDRAAASGRQLGQLCTPISTHPVPALQFSIDQRGAMRRLRQGHPPIRELRIAAIAANRCPAATRKIGSSNA